MIKLLSFLFFIFLVIDSVSAVQFSPTALEFAVEKGKTSCRNIFVQLDSAATVSDVWTYGNGDWKFSDFTLSSDELKLKTSYPPKIYPTEEEIEFCLTALQAGSYKGALVFTQGRTGNSIIQFAVWLRVVVNESDSSPVEDNEEESYSGKSSSRSGSNGGLIYGDVEKEFLSMRKNELTKENSKLLLAHKVNLEKSNVYPENIFLGIFFMLFIAALVFLIWSANKKNLKLNFNNKTNTLTRNYKKHRDFIF